MQSGGYDYDFVNTPSDTLICQICQCPSREPHLSVCCGHIFCKSCLEGANRVTFVTNACPMCRSEEFVTVPNLQADRIIRSLIVYCSNKNEGCEWQGEINAINSHLSNSNGCQFHEVNCPNDCGRAYQRQYLTSHVDTECPRRKVNCQYCHDIGEYQFIDGQHKEKCPKFPLQCPNSCGIGIIPRDGVREHINVCPLQLIQCKYHIIGCEVTMARKDQEKHNKEMMEEHLSLSVTELAATKAKSEQQDQNFRELFASNKISMESMENYFKDQLASTKMSMEEDFREQLLASQHDAQKTIQDLTSKLATAEKEIVVLKQQLDSNDKALAEAETKFQSIEEATQKSLTEQESKLQSIEAMAWSTYLFSEAAKLFSGIEVLPVVIKMSDFTKKKRQKTQWFSQPFYTHSNGYKIQLSVLFNDNVGSHMSVALYIMKGPYDGQLEWPMKGTYKVTMLNQSSNSMHHSVTHSVTVNSSHRPSYFSDRNLHASWHSESFISHEHLTTSNQFLKDDNLYFKVSKLSD